MGVIMSLKTKKVEINKQINFYTQKITVKTSVFSQTPVCFFYVFSIINIDIVFSIYMIELSHPCFGKSKRSPN